MKREKILSLLMASVISLSMLSFVRTDVSATEDEDEYWKGYESRYYYENALTDQEKELYDLFDSAMVEVLASDEDIEHIYVDLTKYHFDDSEETMYYVNDMVVLVVHCSPQYFFWWIPAPVFDEIDGERCLVGYILGILPDFRDGEARQKAKAEVKQLLDSYINAVPSDALPEEKEKIIHDLMCERITYGEYVLPSGTGHDQGIYSALKGQTVCMGYADLFQALMCKLGVECTMVSNEGHAWDAIKLHGYWYYVDVTNDDCFDPIGYPTYNFTAERYKPEGVTAKFSADIKPQYDMLDDDPDGSWKFTNYSSRYIHKGDDIYFILNDLDDVNGRLCLYLNADTTNVKTVDYNGVTYNVKNYSGSVDTSSDKKVDFSDFIERLYVVALGRDSEKEGKDFWCEKVRNGALSGADCAREFLFSKEFLEKNISDEEFIKILYRTFFDREAVNDPSGYHYWMSNIGSLGRRQVIESFINSEEWCNVCASYGVSSGAKYAKATVASSNSIAFATRLYKECLGREPEEDGLKYWSLGLTNQELTGSQAAREFFYSKEFIDFKLSDDEYVTRLYKTFMGRDPEKEGYDYWIRSLSQGMSRDEVFNFFSGCPEFTDVCNSYAIKR